MQRVHVARFVPFVDGPLAPSRQHGRRAPLAVRAAPLVQWLNRCAYA